MPFEADCARPLHGETDGQAQWSARAQHNRWRRSIVLFAAVAGG